MSKLFNLPVILVQEVTFAGTLPIEADTFEEALKEAPRGICAATGIEDSEQDEYGDIVRVFVEPRDDHDEDITYLYNQAVEDSNRAQAQPAPSFVCPNGCEDVIPTRNASEFWDGQAWIPNDDAEAPYCPECGADLEAAA